MNHREQGQNAYDALNRVIKTTAYGNETDTTDNATTVRFVYDSLGRRTSVADPDSGTWTYAYDSNGNLVYQNDPIAEKHLEFCYDQLNRLRCKSGYYDDQPWSGGTLCPATATAPCPASTTAPIVDALATYHYDQPVSPDPSDPGSLCGASLGRLCQVDDTSGLTTLAYDLRGRNITSKKVITNYTGGFTGMTLQFTFERTYDEADHLLTMNYPTDVAAEILTYGYDAAGHVMTATTPGQTYLNNARYDRFGRLTLQSYGPSIVANYWTYADGTSGAANQFRLQEAHVASGAATYLRFLYGPYDKAGNLLGVTDDSLTYAPGYTYADNSARDNDWSYTYDGLGRLQTMIPGSTTTWGAAAAFGYDWMGNLTWRGTLTFTPDPAKPHRVRYSSVPGASRLYQYDLGGGLTSRPDTDGGGADTARTVTYDREGHVATVSIASGPTMTYEYDYTGARVLRAGEPTNYGDWYFGPFFEVTESGAFQLTRHIYANGRRIAQSTVVLNSSSPLVARTDAVEKDTRLVRRWPDALGERGLLYPVVVLANEEGAKLGVLVLLVLIVLDLTPGRVRLGVGIGRMRRGHVLVVLVLFGLTLTPLTCVRAARAGGGGGGGGGGEERRPRRASPCTSCTAISSARRHC